LTQYGVSEKPTKGKGGRESDEILRMSRRIGQEEMEDEPA
jgi:hypothetical protein